MPKKAIEYSKPSSSQLYIMLFQLVLKPHHCSGKRGAMRGGIKRVVLIALVIAGFVAFDFVMDYLGRNFYPFLFNLIVYPLDISGTLEYSVGIGVFFLSAKRSIEWLNTGTIACFAYSFVIIATKLILH